jgi:hypothetical protein
MSTTIIVGTETIIAITVTAIAMTTVAKSATPGKARTAARDDMLTMRTAIS